MASDNVLERIDAKLGALLSISVDHYLRETGLARPKGRSIDKLLTDAGLGAPEVAAVLGKTERAVYKLLQEEQERPPRAAGSKTRRRAKEAR